jgi:hypothetical protein
MDSIVGGGGVVGVENCNLSKNWKLLWLTCLFSGTLSIGTVRVLELNTTRTIRCTDK